MKDRDCARIEFLSFIYFFENVHQQNQTQVRSGITAMWRVSDYKR